jgi:8-oxoguanine deaminase
LPSARWPISRFKLDELRFSGAGDPLAALVLCGAYQADRVMIGGEWVVEQGRIGQLDLEALIRRHSAAARKLQAY